MNNPFSIDTNVWKLTTSAGTALFEESLDMWHRKPGHISEKVVLTMAKINRLVTLI
jgi:hypothetical protein